MWTDFSASAIAAALSVFTAYANADYNTTSAIIIYFAAKEIPESLNSQVSVVSVNTLLRKLLYSEKGDRGGRRRGRE